MPDFGLFHGEFAAGADMIAKIIAMRYNDVRDGTDIVEGVLERYQKALTAKAMIGTDGLYARFYAVKQDRSVPATQAAHTAW